MAGGVMLIAFSPSPVGTIAGALAMGVFGTLSLMTDQAILSDLHGDQRTIALTESNVIATLSAIMAPLVIGLLAGAGFGWQAGLALTLPWAALLWWGFRDVRFPRALPATRGHEGSHRLPAVFWILCVVLFLTMAVEWCMAYWGADFLVSAAGFERATAATAMTLFFVAMAGGRIAGSRLAWRYSSISLLLASMAIALVGFLLFWLGPAPAASLTGLFVAGLGIANLYPLTVAVATSVAPHLIDLTTARLAVAGGIALLIAPLAVGALSDAAGMRRGFGIVAPLLVIAFACTQLSGRWLKHQLPSSTTVPATPPAAP
jgi:MFS family permease